MTIYLQKLKHQKTYYYINEKLKRNLELFQLEIYINT